MFGYVVVWVHGAGGLFGSSHCFLSSSFSKKLAKLTWCEILCFSWDRLKLSQIMLGKYIEDSSSSS